MDSKQNSIRSHCDLDVWKNAIVLSEKIYRVTTSFPKSELFGLVSQLRRASVSVAANIAEGFGRNSAHNKELVQFLYYSQGSLSELETLILISRNVRYMEDEEFKKIQALIIKNRMLLRNLIHNFKNKH